MLKAQAKEKLIQLLHTSGHSFEKIDFFACDESGNNQAYLLLCDDKKWLAKFYRQDHRDRLGAETAFLKYAAHEDVGMVPQLIAQDAIERIAIISFIEGKKLSKEEVGLSEIQQAVHFIKALNKPSQWVPALPNAAEACFNWQDHVRLVEDRVTRLKANPYQGDLAKDYFEFVHAMQDKWETIKRVQSNVPTAQFLLSENERCLSPSDFGFHNAIRMEDGRLHFIDFEYAGWDDPAKMIVDFFLQPAVPVSQKYFSFFLTELKAIFRNADALQERVNVLRPLLSIKWCCIMLNAFFPTYFKSEHVQKERLNQAWRYLSET